MTEEPEVLEFSKTYKTSDRGDHKTKTRIVFGVKYPELSKSLHHMGRYGSSDKYSAHYAKAFNSAVRAGLEYLGRDLTTRESSPAMEGFTAPRPVTEITELELAGFRLSYSLRCGLYAGRDLFEMAFSDKDWMCLLETGSTRSTVVVSDRDEMTRQWFVLDITGSVSQAGLYKKMGDSHDRLHEMAKERAQEAIFQIVDDAIKTAGAVHELRKKRAWALHVANCYRDNVDASYDQAELPGGELHKLVMSISGQVSDFESRTILEARKKALEEIPDDEDRDMLMAACSKALIEMNQASSVRIVSPLDRQMGIDCFDEVYQLHREKVRLSEVCRYTEGRYDWVAVDGLEAEIKVMME